jgi:hypothetical protein
MPKKAHSEEQIVAVATGGSGSASGRRLPQGEYQPCDVLSVEAKVPLQSAVFLPPAVERLHRDLGFLAGLWGGFSVGDADFDRSIVTICSGLYFCMGMTRFSSKWILSLFPPGTKKPDHISRICPKNKPSGKIAPPWWQGRRRQSSRRFHFRRPFECVAQTLVGEFSCVDWDLNCTAMRH